MDGAIHRAAGPMLLKENKEHHKGCPDGEAVISGGYKLPAKCELYIYTFDKLKVTISLSSDK